MIHTQIAVNVTAQNTEEINSLMNAIRMLNQNREFALAIGQVREDRFNEDEVAQIHQMTRISGLNVVTCFKCGKILIQRTEEEETRCPHCSAHSDMADFPDYFYQDAQKSETRNYNIGRAIDGKTEEFEKELKALNDKYGFYMDTETFEEE